MSDQVRARKVTTTEHQTDYDRERERVQQLKTEQTTRMIKYVTATGLPVHIYDRASKLGIDKFANTRED